VDAQTIGLLAVALAIALGLVEVVKALVGRLGNGKRNGNGNGRSSTEVRKLLEDHTECRGAMLSIHQQVQDRDGVPLSFHLREQIKISRAMLERMESMAQSQNDTAHILEKLEAHSGD
jgi:hypothetical protein